MAHKDDIRAIKTMAFVQGLVIGMIIGVCLMMIVIQV